MIADRILHWARRQPDNPAIVHNGLIATYADFARAIWASRRFFESLNLPFGRTAIVVVSNLRDAWLIVLGLRLAGLDTICAQSVAQVKSLRLRNAGCLVTTEDLRSEAEVSPDLRVVVVRPQTFAALDRNELPAEAVGSERAGGHILHTSGSTGTRKKLLLPSAIEDRLNAARASYYSCSEQTVHHGMDFGLWTGIGYRQTANVWQAGGTVVLDQRVGHVTRFLDHGVNRTCLTPEALKELIDGKVAYTAPGKGMEVRVAGGHMSLALAEAAVDQLAGELYFAYSASEFCLSPLQSWFRTAEDLVWLSPAGGHAIQIVDEDGTPCPPGQDGRLRVRLTENDFDAYFEDEAATAKAFAGGYFYPGDRAVERADGRIRLLGRDDDVINVGGQKLPTAPLEQAIQRQMRVEEVCLFSRILDNGEQELVIAIQCDRELPQFELDALTREFDHFDRVGVAVFAEFPRTTSGLRKTLRAELKDRAFSAAPARSGGRV